MWQGLIPAPALVRPLVKGLHWGILALLILALSLGLTPAIRWLFIATTALWCTGFALFGQLGKAGPALTGLARRSFDLMHIALILAIAVTALATWRAAPGPLADPTRMIYLVTLGMGLLHGIFHLWRHTALNDGALRNMTPRLLHGIL